MRKRNWLLAMVICLASGVKAQFSSSDHVYCYEYQYTMEDGIKSQYADHVIFVNFQKDMIGFVQASKEEVASKGVGYFEKEARNKIAENARKWNSSAPGQFGQADIYSYDDDNSSGSKYTYRRKTKFSTTRFTGYGWSNSWQNEFWNGDCYTFSSDRSEFVEWYLSKPRNVLNYDSGSRQSDYTKIRRYYKKIDADKLKPSVDDLF